MGLHLKYRLRLATILGCVAAEREDAGRFIFRADEKLTAFVERAVCIHLLTEQIQRMKSPFIADACVAGKSSIIRIRMAGDQIASRGHGVAAQIEHTDT
ncbi:MAG: hypothetical protein DMF32_01950 [Verrucomicrobia bacterium]|nr:MAG: hypothetical protein DMF32_01950 [Verrucomicrobiota bacterium]